MVVDTALLILPDLVVNGGGDDGGHCSADTAWLVVDGGGGHRSADTAWLVVDGGGGHRSADIAWLVVGGGDDGGGHGLPKMCIVRST